jgi:hypothetical protein
VFNDLVIRNRIAEVIAKAVVKAFANADLKPLSKK